MQKPEKNKYPFFNTDHFDDQLFLDLINNEEYSLAAQKVLIDVAKTTGNSPEAQIKRKKSLSIMFNWLMEHLAEEFWESYSTSNKLVLKKEAEHDSIPGIRLFCRYVNLFKHDIMSNDITILCYNKSLLFRKNGRICTQKKNRMEISERIFKYSRPKPPNSLIIIQGFDDRLLIDIKKTLELLIEQIILIDKEELFFEMDEIDDIHIFIPRSIVPNYDYESNILYTGAIISNVLKIITKFVINYEVKRKIVFQFDDESLYRTANNSIIMNSLNLNQELIYKNKFNSQKSLLTKKVDGTFKIIFKGHMVTLKQYNLDGLFYIQAIIRYGNKLNSEGISVSELYELKGKTFDQLPREYKEDYSNNNLTITNSSSFAKVDEETIEDIQRRIALIKAALDDNSNLDYDENTLDSLENEKTRLEKELKNFLNINNKIRSGSNKIQRDYKKVSKAIKKIFKETEKSDKDFYSYLVKAIKYQKGKYTYKYIPSEGIDWILDE